jgi:negative regulator of sigma E activity
MNQNINQGPIAGDPQPNSSYERTQTYTSKDGRTSTRISHIQAEGVQYQMIETQSSDPKEIEKQNQTEKNQRDQIAEDMNQEINATLAKMASINQFNNKLEPGLMIPQSQS